MNEPRTGSERLSRWMEKTGKTPVDVAVDAHVSKAAVYFWKEGTTRPDFPAAVRLEDLTDGDVPIEAWGYERDLIDRMGSVVQRRLAAAGAR